MGRIFAVAGDAILHDRSPVMFNTALRELAIDAVYIRCAVSSAEELIALARQMGLEGFNTTAHLKTEIIPHLDEVEADARKIGSVNTVVSRDGNFVGYNTDVTGVLGAVRSSGFDPAGQKVVVLGAGGTGRSAALALLSSGAEVTVMDPILDEAEKAAQLVGCRALPIDHMEDALNGAGLLVSTVSAVKRVVEPRLLSRGLFVLEADCSGSTPLVKDVLSAGCTLIDGKEWLLAQAVPAFTLFTGEQAPAETMRKALWKIRRDGRKNIALIGFMGTGKSSVAEKIAGLGDMDVIDIDTQIEAKEGIPIHDIFGQRGEEAFRRMEQAEIDEIRFVTHTVVSCGGGAVLKRANVRVLRNTCLTVWLWAGVKTILERTAEGGTRPLLNVADPEDRVRTLLQERLFLYAATSDFVVSTEGKKPEEIAKGIWHEVRDAISG